MNYVIYETPSLIDHQSIVVIASGIDTTSRNPKTGRMAQTRILRADILPGRAIKNGTDQSVHGDFSLRGKKGKQRTCFANVDFAPRAMFQGYKAGQVKEATISKQRIALDRDRLNRIGSYGDLSAVPVSVWADLTQIQRGSTGYSTYGARNIRISGDSVWHRRNR